MRYFATEGTEADLFGFLFLEGEQSLGFLQFWLL